MLAKPMGQRYPTTLEAAAADASVVIGRCSLTPAYTRAMSTLLLKIGARVLAGR